MAGGLGRALPQAINFERGTLRIFQQLRRARPKRGEPQQFVLQSVKTQAGERTLKLDADLIEMLRVHKANQDEERALLGEKWRDPWGTLVFTSDILPLTVKDLHASKAYCREHGLLTNDSLIVAVMRNQRLRHLASHDGGFARVTGLQLWDPGRE